MLAVLGKGLARRGEARDGAKVACAGAAVVSGRFASVLTRRRALFVAFKYSIGRSIL